MSQFTEYDDIGPSYLDILPTDRPSVHTYEQIQLQGKFYENFNTDNDAQRKYLKPMQNVQRECNSKTGPLSSSRPFCKTL